MKLLILLLLPLSLFGASDFTQTGWDESKWFDCNGDNSMYLFNTHSRLDNLTATLNVGLNGTYRLYMRSRGHGDRSNNVHVEIDGQVFSYNQKSKHCSYELVGVVTNPSQLTVSTINTGNDYTIVDKGRFENISCSSGRSSQGVRYYDVMGRIVDFESAPSGIYIKVSNLGIKKVFKE